jgi:MerR family transcriptional regulator, heat shock protein HspR
MIDRPDTPGTPAPSQGVYGITVAAELSGIPVQSLRLYERHGLLTPSRSDGGTRRYSADDLARLQRISALVAAGVNLAGIAHILDLQDDNAELLAANKAMGKKATKKTTSETDSG